MFKKVPYTGRLRRSTPVGEISSHSNEVSWIIPKFFDLRRNIVYSAAFGIADVRWRLFLRPFGTANPTSGQSEIEIGVCQPYSGEYEWFFKEYLKEKEIPEKNFNVRLGINGRNTKLSCIGKLYSLDKELSFQLLDRSELIRKKYLWMPEGNFNVFLSMEVVGEESATIMGCNKLQQDLKDLMQNGNISNVVLKVDNQEFKSHRCILAARSPVFMAMMSHVTEESATDVVEIKDVDPNIFSDFLRYLYTGCLEDITLQNAQGLFRAADQYQVQELKKHCMKHMMEGISVDNFCDLYLLSLLYEEKDLTAACSQFFIKNSLNIIKTSKWQLFLAENPTVGNELYMKQLQMNE